MEDNKIWYSEIKKRGFTEQKEHDKVYYRQYGFNYCIIEKKLTKTIYLDWEKETGLCYLYRIDGPKECRIKGKMLVRSLEQLDEIINFFTDKN